MVCRSPYRVLWPAAGIAPRVWPRGAGWVAVNAPLYVYRADGDLQRVLPFRGSSAAGKGTWNHEAVHMLQWPLLSLV